jgi:hypothetical protein
MSEPSWKKKRFSGKKHREAGQVDLSHVDLGLGEVGVDRERRVQVRTQLLGGIQAELAVVFGVGLLGRRAQPRDVGRADRQAEAEIEVRQIREPAGAARLVDQVVAVGARPAAGLLQALHAALDVESPGVEVGPVAQALDRNAHRDRPAGSVARRLRFPDRIPLAVDGLALRRDQAIETRPVGVDRENVAGARVEVRVEHDDQVVLDRQIGIARLREGHDALRVGIVTACARSRCRRHSRAR